MLGSVIKHVPHMGLIVKKYIEKYMSILTPCFYSVRTRWSKANLICTFQNESTVVYFPTQSMAAPKQLDNNLTNKIKLVRLRSAVGDILNIWHVKVRK